MLGSASAKVLQAVVLQPDGIDYGKDNFCQPTAEYLISAEQSDRAWETRPRVPLVSVDDHKAMFIIRRSEFEGDSQ